MTTNSNDPFSSLAPQPTVSEIVNKFDSLDWALGWAIDAEENGFLAADEFLTFCKDLKAYHDPYARSVALTGWVEEVNARHQLAAEITNAG